MKKIVVIFLCLAMILGSFGCSPKTTEKEEPQHNPGYSRLWGASEDSVTHETGALAIDDGWGAVISEDSKSGALTAVTVELQPTQYLFAARMLTNGYESTNTNVVAKMRVLGADGTELGSSVLTMRDFGASLTYGDFTCTFNVAKKQNVTLQIYWPGYEYVRVSEFAVMSKNTDTKDYKTVPEQILGVDKEESVPTVDDSKIYFFDLATWVKSMPTQEDQYDIQNLIATLQGLVNRDGQRLFIKNENVQNANTDTYWLTYLTADNNWLSNKEVVTIETPITLLKMFESYYNGFAVWDQAVPATVNAVATACGVDGLLPLRYSSDKASMYAYLLGYDGFETAKTVKVDLANKFMTSDKSNKIYDSNTNCTGSRKNDVYVWAKEQYLDTHKTNSHLMAYHVDAYSLDKVSASYSHIDNMYLSNREYYIAEKAFFFDLSVMEFEIPDDDPDQAELDVSDGTIDYATFTAIMESQNAYAAEVDANKVIDVGGFTPWHLKYTRYTNSEASGEVDVEWETVYQFSVYFASINADAPSLTAMANASIYRKFPMQQSYEQSGKYSKDNVDSNEKLPKSNEQGVNYLLFYFGDFDSSAWLNSAMINFWNDPKRGEIPIAYSFALDLYKRAGHVVDWMYGTATENDYFVAGDNGTGYLNPEAFYANWRNSNLNGNLEKWIAYNRPVYERFDIDITGFLILSGRASSKYDEILNAYAQISPVGLGTNVGSLNGTSHNGMQIVREMDYSSTAALANGLSDKTNNGQCTFTMVRFILQSPTNIYNMYQELLTQYTSKNVKVLDPYTFFALQAEYNK